MITNIIISKRESNNSNHSEYRKFKESNDIIIDINDSLKILEITNDKIISITETFENVTIWYKIEED